MQTRDNKVKSVDPNGPLVHRLERRAGMASTDGTARTRKIEPHADTRDPLRTFFAEVETADRIEAQTGKKIGSSAGRGVVRERAKDATGERLLYTGQVMDDDRARGQKRPSSAPAQRGRATTKAATRTQGKSPGRPPTERALFKNNATTNKAKAAKDSSEWKTRLNDKVKRSGKDFDTALECSNDELRLSSKDWHETHRPWTSEDPRASRANDKAFV